MTKKDYILIAKAINKAQASLRYASVNMAETQRCLSIVAETFASELARENVRFDSVKFLQACNIITN